MRIGVITYYNSDDNYGQILQCFALQKYLEMCGHSVFLIKYAPEKKKSFTKRILDFFYEKEKKKYFFFVKELFFQKCNYKKNRIRKFDLFKKDNIIATTNVYRSIDELRLNPPVADVYICGSDQIWNNSLYDDNSAGWFLNFGNVPKRIAYAASFGRMLNESEFIILKNYLKEIDFVSVREFSAKKMCESQNIKDIRVVADPTLLLNKSIYFRLMDSNEKKETMPYVFLYALNVKNENDICWNQVYSFAKESNLKLKYVNASGFIAARTVVKRNKPLYLTIPEWLSSLLNSEYVITNSFHGVVFSVIFHKKFVVIPLKKNMQYGNMRIYDFLKLLNLENRIYDGNSLLQDMAKSNIDWNDVDHNLHQFIQDSKMFLENALRL